MAYSVCSNNYHRMKVDAFGLFVASVKKGYYETSSLFPSPPLTKAQFEALQNKYHSSYIDYKNGGRNQKGDYMTALHKLIAALDEIADNVNEVAQGNENVIMEAGYKPTKTSRSEKHLPPQPKTEILDRGGEGVLKVQCNMLGSEIYYGCILCEEHPLDERVNLQNGKLIIPAGLTTALIIDENKSRKKTFINLKPGKRYYVYFFARNSAGVSQLSEERSIICG